MTIKESLQDSLKRLESYMRAREHIKMALAEINAAEGERSHGGDSEISTTGGLESPLPTNLTRREEEIYKMLGEGLKPREIAAKLGTSLRTIEAQRNTLRQKLGFETSHELTQKAKDNFGRGRIK